MADSVTVEGVEYNQIDWDAEEMADWTAFHFILVDTDEDVILDNNDTEAKLLGPAQRFLKKYPAANLAIYERTAVLSLARKGH